MKRICVLPGDGIGPEVVDQAVRVLGALGLPLAFEHAEIGYGAYQRSGTALPTETLDRVAAADGSLFGAVTTPAGVPGYRSPILGIRTRFDLYANVRPCVSVPHAGSAAAVDLVIVRENTEGLYSGRERREDGGDTAVTERVITRTASERIMAYGCELARRTGRRRLTIVHKANVLRESCGLFREAALAVAGRYPEITAEEMLVDACAMELVRAPQRFQVIVTTNLFGDILSDLACALTGGPGLAPSANVGSNVAVFEPVHGSAPDLAGRGTANPLAAILSGALLLEYLGWHSEAGAVRRAVHGAVERNLTTPDLGGTLSTAQATDVVIDGLVAPPVA